MIWTGPAIHTATSPACLQNCPDMESGRGCGSRCAPPPPPPTVAFWVAVIGSSHLEGARSAFTCDWLRMNPTLLTRETYFFFFFFFFLYPFAFSPRPHGARASERRSEGAEGRDRKRGAKAAFGVGTATQAR